MALEAGPGSGRGGLGFAWMILPRGHGPQSATWALLLLGEACWGGGGGNPRGRVTKQNLDKESHGRRQGLLASVCLWGTQGPTVKVSALSQALSSSSAPLWFGAQQCLKQSLLPTPINQRSRGSGPAH